MIKVKSIAYQQDTVQATIEYDLEGETHSFTLGAKLSHIHGMTVEELKTYIVGRVQNQRAIRLRELVEAKLSGLIDVDLEATL